MIGEPQLLKDKEISYWITSHSHYDRTNQLGFNWPPKPDPEMGKEFCDKIDAWFNEVDSWIRNNPERYKQAVLGRYKPFN